MNFNSIDFALFLPLVFILYWGLAKKGIRIQNIILLISSYFFYACWDYRFLFLLIFSTLLDYYTGLKMFNAASSVKKRIWFWLSVGLNLGFLGFFKYYNFFVKSFAEAVSLLGFTPNYWTLQVILPVGISFYTFHGLSYVIDIYKGRIKPESSFINYSVFVSFFPLLVAGPIERATHLLPQIVKKREFNYAKAVDGMRQILWGLFKKIVIADNCAEYANQAFSNSSAYSASTHLIAAVFFALQIYCDFSGYSDIALGTARLFGIDLLRNFAFPYFSRDIAEFWRRWHISLSSWFRDYLYIPLGGSKGSTLKNIRNIFIIFIVSGFWHGANWTFIFWGLLNALYIIPSVLTKRNRDNLDIVATGRFLPSLRESLQIISTFFLTVIAWIFFRSENLTSAFNYLYEMFTSLSFSRRELPSKTLFLVIIVFMLAEWIGREQQYALAKIETMFSKFARITVYLLLIIFIFTFKGSQQQFIYFQF